jgi:hypothetical protein
LRYKEFQTNRLNEYSSGLRAVHPEWLSLVVLGVIVIISIFSDEKCLGWSNFAGEIIWMTPKELQGGTSSN